MKIPQTKKSFHNFLLILLFLSFTNVLKSQQTLTKINGWNAYVHLPANYTSTTINYPTIIFFPGVGEIGTNASALIANGPGAYITQGWNGNVVVDGNTVEFIVISLQPPIAYPNEIQINDKIQIIKSTYRVDNDKLYLTGLSHGGWCSSTFVTGDALGGPYNYASQIAAVVEVQGVVPDDNSPYPQLFDNFANNGGRLLGFEQSFDNRGVPTRVNRMNATVPNSAIYVKTNFGGGGHCCWNQYYGGQRVMPGNFLLDGVSQNLYQWLARQSRKSKLNRIPNVNAGSDLSITLPINSATLNGTGTDLDGTIVSYAWTKVSGPVAGTLANATLASATANGLVEGIYKYELKVTDNVGGVGKDTIQVTVNAAAPPPNQLPTSNAGSDLSITLPINSATLNGTGTDLDGTIVSYAWTKVSGPVAGTLANATLASATANGLVEGIYKYELKVTDNVGGVGKDTIQVRVNVAASLSNQLPTANAGADFAITLPIKSASLNGSGTGFKISFQWTKLSGHSSGNISNATSATVSLTNLTNGIYKYQLTVTDSLGKTAKDTIILTVNLPIRVVNVFPNPVSSIANVEIENIGSSDIVTMVLNDGKGAQIYEKANIKLPTGGIIERMDMQKFKAGLYFLKIVYSDGTFISKKVIKQ
jgi:hypothetical protein